MPELDRKTVGAQHVRGVRIDVDVVVGVDREPLERRKEEAPALSNRTAEHSGPPRAGETGRTRLHRRGRISPGGESHRRSGHRPTGRAARRVGTAARRTHRGQSLPEIRLEAEGHHTSLSVGRKIVVTGSSITGRDGRVTTLSNAPAQRRAQHRPPRSASHDASKSRCPGIVYDVDLRGRSSMRGAFKSKHLPDKKP